MQKPIRAITSVDKGDTEVINGFVWRMGMFLVFHIRLASDFYVSLVESFNERNIELELDRLGEIWAD